MGDKIVTSEPKLKLIKYHQFSKRGWKDVLKVLISEAFNHYRSGYIVLKNLSPKTTESYDGAAKLLIRKFGDIDVTTLSHRHITDWYEWLLGWQSRDTAKNNICCLRMVLKFLRNSGVSVMNYEEIPVPQRMKRKIIYLTDSEIIEFIQEVKRPRRGYTEIMRLRNEAIVTLLYATGLRNSELCALDRDSIKNRTFTVIGKSKSPHIAFIDERTEMILNNYFSKRTDVNPAAFISAHGTRITSPQLRNMFEITRTRSSKFSKVHPHTIRHSFATKLLKRQVDLRYISDLMGHADLNTTKLYTHYENPQLKEIYDNAHGLLT